MYYRKVLQRHGVTASRNTHEGLRAPGVHLISFASACCHGAASRSEMATFLVAQCRLF